MSYKIEPKGISDFLNTKIHLPRFQRKQTWKPNKNFELAISVFLDYPIGVVVLNETILNGKRKSWLLDGRQRRNALDEIRKNPLKLYEWARTYLRFSPNCSPMVVKEAFTKRVSHYLQREEVESFYDDPSDAAEGAADVVDVMDSDDLDGDDEETLENSFNSQRQKEGLYTLLGMINMVHPMRAGKSYWQQLFDFSKCVNLQYLYYSRNTGTIDPIKLRQVILEFAESEGDVSNITKESFYEFWSNKAPVLNEKKFKERIARDWDEIHKSVELIWLSEDVFKHSQIGVITLINATPMDAQSIFSRINQGGTQLKPEELLSAKPFWNKPVPECDTQVKKYVDNIYKLIGTEAWDNVVRWDIAATFIDRIESDREYPLLFGKREEVDAKKYANLSKDNDPAFKRVTRGFKLLSSLMEKGCSNKHVLALEKREHDKDDWQNKVDDYVYALNLVCSILRGDELFGTLGELGCPIVDLLGEGPTWEWIVTLVESWHELDCPRKGQSGANNQFRQRARLHFDALLYEKLSGIWKGSSDSRMANNLKKWKERVSTKVDDRLWDDLLVNACNGVINSRNTAKAELKPLLYYAAALRGELGPLYGRRLDVDHIIPEAKLADNSQIPQSFKDSLSNLTLLPNIENRQKNATLLKDLDNENLLQEKAIFACGITEKELELFSDGSRYSEIIGFRLKVFRDIFNRRVKLLSQA